MDPNLLLHRSRHVSFPGIEKLVGKVNLMSCCSYFVIKHNLSNKDIRIDSKKVLQFHTIESFLLRKSAL